MGLDIADTLYWPFDPPDKERETQISEKPLQTPEQQRISQVIADALEKGVPTFEGDFAAPLDPLEATGIGLAERFAGSPTPAISGLAGEALTGLLTGEGRGIELIRNLFDVSRQLSSRGDADVTEQIRTAAVAQGAGGSGQLLETLRRFGEGRALQQEKGEFDTLSKLFVQAIGGAQKQGGIEDQQTLLRSGAATQAGGLRRSVADLFLQRIRKQFNLQQGQEQQLLNIGAGFAASPIPFGVTDYSAFTPTFAGEITPALIEGGTDLLAAFLGG